MLMFTTAPVGHLHLSLLNLLVTMVAEFSFVKAAMSKTTDDLVRDMAACASRQEDEVIDPCHRRRVSVLALVVAAQPL